MSIIVDPSDSNYAIADGKLAVAVRAVEVANWEAPTVAELAGGKIIGYSTDGFGPVNA
jgi:hypothetical protein